MSKKEGDLLLEKDFALLAQRHKSDLKLNDGSKVAVIGSGPAGSFVSYFLLDMAEKFGKEIQVDIYDPQDFAKIGPSGCNHCGGIISESLVQIMAADGINLPKNVIQRGIDSYVLHMDVGTVKIETPFNEKRIASVFRGSGPRGTKVAKWGNSFDRYLQLLAFNKGAHIIRKRVNSINWIEGLPQVLTNDGKREIYDLVVGAVGINTSALKLFEGLKFGYKPPETVKTYISELPLDDKTIQKYLGNSMHLFLLNLPGLEFAALIPKRDFVTLVMLGDKINKELIKAFLETPEVKECLPPEWQAPEKICHCSPKINIRQASKPFVDRLVLIGDSGVSRLYKDGIGSAYRTAKAVASTAVFFGISAEDFRKHYFPTYKSIASDNVYGRIVFSVTSIIQKIRFARRALLNTVSAEQHNKIPPRMSKVLWDTFTGSATYKDVFLRTLHPIFNGRLLWNMILALLPFFREIFNRKIKKQETELKESGLKKDQQR